MTYLECDTRIMFNESDVVLQTYQRLSPSRQMAGRPEFLDRLATVVRLDVFRSNEHALSIHSMYVIRIKSRVLAK